jgi:creatinine amidohydrolase
MRPTTSVRNRGEAARLAWDAGADRSAADIPFGVQAGQLTSCSVSILPEHPGCRSGACGADGQGVRKLVILNGHGGNDFRSMIRELQPGVKIFLCMVNWYQIVDAADYFEDLGDHAGEMETSIM